MSLAEIVLFLLFAFFIVYSLKADEGESLPLEIDALRKEIKELRNQISELEKENAELHATLKHKELVIKELEKLTGVTIKEPADVKTAVTAVRRGAPPCTDDNVVVEVTARHGAVAMRMLRSVAELVGDPASYPSIRAGETLSEPQRIEAILAAIWRYESAKGCRYDYRLTYATPEDYHAVRVRFERYFFPAGGIRQVP